MADMPALQRLDSFPYSHRVHEVMGSPLVTAAPDTGLGEAAAHMAEAGISSLVVADDAARPLGIVTERDVLRALARHRQAAVTLPLHAVMSAPVATVRDDALLYVAIGRMGRLRLRHLVAVDRLGRATGMVTARGLLALRAATALALGDEVVTADGPAAMAHARSMLPPLASALLDDGVGGAAVAAVTSSVLRDMTARAAELAAESLRADGWGAAPAPWCVLLLGSGGRRESLFGADQDNALVHSGTDSADPWFAELGRRINAGLAEAGVPLCQGGVMAGNARWRHDLVAWRGEIDRWMAEADGEELLNVSIFCDFRPVFGESLLAERLRDHLADRAAAAPRFLHAMAATVSGMATGLGLFGRLKTRQGRLDLKLTGLLPLVSTVRLLALKHRVTATGTAERLTALAERGAMPAAEARRFIDGHALMLRLLAHQQVADLADGLPPSNRLDPTRLSGEERRGLKAALKSLEALNWVLGNALSSV